MTRLSLSAAAAAESGMLQGLVCPQTSLSLMVRLQRVVMCRAVCPSGLSCAMLCCAVLRDAALCCAALSYVRFACCAALCCQVQAMAVCYAVLCCICAMLWYELQHDLCCPARLEMCTLSSDVSGGCSTSGRGSPVRSPPYKVPCWKGRPPHPVAPAEQSYASSSTVPALSSPREHQVTTALCYCLPTSRAAVCIVYHDAA